MADGTLYLLVSIVAIFSVMAWHKEVMLILNGWQPTKSKNPIVQMKDLIWNLLQLIKNGLGLISDVLITTWAAGIGGAGSTLALFIGLLISDVVSIYVCSYIYKVTPGQAILGIIKGFPNTLSKGNIS